MKIPTPRVLAAAALFAASAAWAAPAKDRSEAWQDGVASPENFPHFVEGSQERRGEVPDPAVSARAANPYSRKPALRSYSMPAPIRLDAPPLPSLSLPAAAAPSARGFRVSSYAACALAGGLGCILLALGGANSGSPVGAPPPLYPSPTERAPELVSLPQPPPARAWTPPPEPAAPSAPLGADPYAPIASWRAISWREQKLIDGWDRSPEKALGLASFDAWLDARGVVAGVDIPRLKAKLYREASDSVSPKQFRLPPVGRRFPNSP